MGQGNEHPRVEAGEDAIREATEAVARFVANLQAGFDAPDAEQFNRQFADNVSWGSPFGEVVHGYERLHAIHERFHRAKRPSDPGSRYEIESVLVPVDGVAVAHVRRGALDDRGEAVPASEDASVRFSEMALYVLVRRGAAWWLVAGQNTPIHKKG